MNYTEEQLSVIKSKHKRIRVKSPAGSGKTTTLIGYAKENFEKEILCIMFNRDLRKSTKRKLPINCTVETLNSLAYRNSEYKGRTIVENLTAIDVMNIMGVKEINTAYAILDQYMSFCHSDKNDGEGPGIRFYKKIKEKHVRVDHNFILKEFSLSEAVGELKFNTIMIDEAQDMNPVMLDIIGKIKHTKEIFIGDPMQNAYGFRDTVSIFDIKGDFKDFQLTKSFRFGEAIAEKVNGAGRYMYGEKFIHSIVGNKEINSKILGKGDIVVGHGAAYITRTNAHLFEKALECALLGVNISIPFDWEELKSNLKDLIFLKIGMREKISNPIFLKYKDFGHFKSGIKKRQNVEMAYLVKIIDTYDIAVLEYISLIEQFLSSQKYADIVLTTTHKAKGLEFISVELGSDFKPHGNTEEKNLVYIAMTRAIKELHINNVRWTKR